MTVGEIPIPGGGNAGFLAASLRDPEVRTGSCFQEHESLLVVDDGFEAHSVDSVSGQVTAGCGWQVSSFSAYQF